MGAKDPLLGRVPDVAPAASPIGLLSTVLNQLDAALTALEEGELLAALSSLQHVERHLGAARQGIRQGLRLEAPKGATRVLVDGRRKVVL